MGADETQLALIRQHFLAGRLDQARAVALRLAQRSPGNAEVNNSCAVVLFQAGDPERALFYARRAADLRPRVGAFRTTIGNILVGLGKRAEALAEFEQAAVMEPFNPAHLIACVPLYWERGEHDRALAATRRAMELDPVGSVGPHTSVLMNIGEFDEAVAALRAELARDPAGVAALGSLAMALNYLPGVERAESLQVHRRYGAAISAMVGPAEAARTVADADRVLRVGFLSPDLYQHSVASFLEPILEHRDPGVMRTVCYSARPGGDATTERLKGLADGWRDVGTEDSAAAAKRIAGDRIDILVDLAGLTGMSQMQVMARRSSPVQVTAIGYPNTTGVPGIGYRLVDAATDPAGVEAFATEELLRLPGCFLCYQPAGDAPEVSAAPCMDGPGVTFGTFNNIMKASEPAMHAWARILATVPGSRLVLKSMQFACASVRERYGERLRRAGMDGARVELLPPTKDRGGVKGHLAAYADMDIALDTFPYNGTTTTCEALWMGVPVVTLEGDRHAGRVGASLLRAVGLPELVGSDVDQYVAIAAGLAREPDRLASLRGGLRERVRGSVLCDGPGYARSFEVALRGAWHRWCATAR